jgi:hypothetical protein
LLIDFDAKNYETGRPERFTAYLIPDNKGEDGYTVFAFQEYVLATTSAPPPPPPPQPADTI